MTHAIARASRAILLAAGLAAIPAAAFAADPVATVHQFLDAFDQGDIAAAGATHAANVVIIDEVAPHVWSGPGAFQAWVGDLTKDSQAAGQTDEQVTLGDTVRSQVDGDTAYVVVKVTFVFKQHGAPMIEPAQMAVALHNQADGWKITGWAWTGTVPQPAPK